MIARSGALCSIFSRKIAALIRTPRPGTCMYMLLGARSSPSRMGKPTIPSFPTVPTSAARPSAIVFTKDATPLSRKWTNSMRWYAS